MRLARGGTRRTSGMMQAHQCADAIHHGRCNLQLAFPFVPHGLCMGGATCPWKRPNQAGPFVTAARSFGRSNERVPSFHCSPKGSDVPAQHTTPPTPSKAAATRLATLSSNERAGWICQSQGGEAPVVLVTGWTGLVRQLAIECVDLAAAPPALAKAQSWLTGNHGSWHFGRDGSASWRILLPDGAWAATLMTNGLTLAKARKILSQ